MPLSFRLRSTDSVETLTTRLKVALERALGCFQGTASIVGFDITRYFWGRQYYGTSLHGRFKPRPDGGTDILVRLRIKFTSWFAMLAVSAYIGIMLRSDDMRPALIALLPLSWIVFVIMFFVEKWFHRRALQALFRIPDVIPGSVS